MLFTCSTCQRQVAAVLSLVWPFPPPSLTSPQTLEASNNRENLLLGVHAAATLGCFHPLGWLKGTWLMVMCLPRNVLNFIHNKRLLSIWASEPNMFMLKYSFRALSWKLYLGIPLLENYCWHARQSWHKLWHKVKTGKNSYRHSKEKTLGCQGKRSRRNLSTQVHSHPSNSSFTWRLAICSILLPQSSYDMLHCTHGRKRYKWRWMGTVTLKWRMRIPHLIYLQTVQTIYSIAY